MGRGGGREVEGKKERGEGGRREGAGEERGEKQEVEEQGICIRSLLQDKCLRDQLVCSQALSHARVCTHTHTHTHTHTKDPGTKLIGTTRPSEQHAYPDSLHNVQSGPHPVLHKFSDDREER